MAERARNLPRAFLLLLAGFALLCLPAPRAEAQILFGKNKVVYDSKDWRVYRDGEIHLYFYTEEEELAQFALAIAREAVDEFSVYFDYQFERAIPIILYGTHHDFKQTNVISSFIGDGTGGFTEFAKGRVTLPATGSYAELRHVLRHELVHAFMLSKLADSMKERGIYDYSLPPLWFIEGMAENVARRYPDTQARMIMRDATLNGGIWSIPDLWQISGTFLMYKHGESIVEFLRTSFGDRTPILLLEGTWRGRGFEEVLQAELGLSYRELSRRWEIYLKRRYYPELLTRRSPDEIGQRILDQGGVETTVSFVSRDRDGAMHLTALSGRSGLIDLYEIHKPVRGPAEMRRIVEGGRRARFESLPAFRSKLDTFDGRYVTFVAKHGGRDKIYIYDLERHRIVDGIAFKEIRQISSPTFSPEGQRIAFSGLGIDGTSDLYVVERESRRLTRLTEDPAEDLHPQWHPFREELVFASDRAEIRSGSHSIYRMDLDRPQDLERLTDRAGDDDQPVYAPDGSAVVYISDRSGTFNLHLLEDGISHQVTNFVGGVMTVDWSSAEPRRVVASVYYAGAYRLYELDLPETSLSESMMAVNAGPAVPPEKRVPAMPASLPEAEDYKVTLGLDFVQSVVALDPDLPSTSGATFGLTDLLGDRQVFVHFSVASTDLSIDNLNAGISYADIGRRLHRHVGIFRLNTQQSINRAFADRVERRTGGFVGLTYPISTFDRVELTAVARYLERNIGFDTFDGPGEAWLASGFLSFVHDNTLWTWEAGPVKGSRWNITFGNTWDLEAEGFDRMTLQFNVRKYLALSRRSVFALRFAQRNSFGSDTQFFYLGGPDDLRGYDRWRFFGNRLTFASMELRLPVLERTAWRFPIAHLELPGIRGYLFNDIGRVDGRIAPTDGWIGAFGVGLAMTLFPPLVLRVDFARPHDFDQIYDWRTRWAMAFLF